MVTDRARSKMAPIDSDQIGVVTDAVRALYVIYSTSLSYRTDHAVFLKAVEERFPLLAAALASGVALHISFSAGEVLCNGVMLDPGSAIFQKMAGTFETVGLVGILLRPGLTADEVVGFIRELTSERGGLGPDFNRRLASEGITHIQQRRIELVEKSEADRGASAPRGGGGESRGGASGRPGVWELDVPAGPEPGAGAPASAADRAAAVKPFQDYVQDVLGTLSRHEATLADVAGLIEQEFELRLERKVEEVRRASEEKIKTLEDVEDIVLQELEHLGLAAIVVDRTLQVVATNASGRRLIGARGNLAADPVLRRFVSGKEDVQQIEIGGERRIARLLASGAPGARGTMLITLERPRRQPEH